MVFHLDYLKLTVFADLPTVQALVERALLEPAGFEARWTDNGRGVRWEMMLEGPGPVFLLVPKDQRTMYTMVEMRGEGCKAMGTEALQGFLAYLRDAGIRWRGKRVDLAFDHVAFTPEMVRDAILRDDMNSRCLNIGDRDWNENAEGKTAYLGKRKPPKPRRLRVYDRRGFNRFEAEFSDGWADKVVQMLAGEPIGAWPTLALRHIRSMVDFIDHSVDERRERCPQLDWWAAFVGSAEKIRNVNEGDRREQFEENAYARIAKSEATFQRVARSLWPMLRAFGEKYLIDRIRHFCEGRIRESDEELARKLFDLRFLQVANLPKYFDYDKDAARQFDDETPL